MEVRVQAEPFDPGAVLARAGAGDPRVGGVAAFTGVVRGEGHGGGRGEGLVALEIEHYPGMTEAAIARIAEEAVARFGLCDAIVVHRHGRLAVGEPIMMVAAAAPHRADAFAAAEFLMDYLKSRAPFWKKEIGPRGEAWVAARQEDEAALGRW